MKKVLSKFKKYSFWIAFVGVVVVFLQNIAKLFGFQLDTGIVESVIMSFCGVLVVLGIVVKDDKTENNNEKTQENTVEKDENEEK